MVARRWNSALRMYCFLRQVRVWIWPTPQLLHRARDVLTATPQPVQGNVPPPLASRALWTLQYSPRQLFPHTSTVPNSSQAQLFVPFIVMLRYTLVYKCLIGEWPLNIYTYLLPGLSSQPCQYTIVGLWPPVLDSWLCVHCTISLIWLLESTAGVIQRCSPLGACIPTTKVGACNIGHYVEAIKSWECSTISHWYRYPRWQYFWCRFEG